VWKLLGGGTRYGHNTRAVVRQIQAAIKGSILRKANFFESLKFRYFGPVDGHDILRLTKLLSDLKRIPGPKVLHIITKKGKGLPLAEVNQTRYHAPGTFDRQTGEIHKDACQEHSPKYQHVFGKTIIELAQQNSKIVAVTPAMASGCSLDMMIQVMPERVFDVGIAEQHAVTFSAGMAAEGLIPFCNIYSSFLQRAYDQIIHDVALQNLPVIFCIDRGGLVGEDGPTHHGVFDLAYLRCIPNIIVAAPMNESELRNMMYSAQHNPQHPYAIRYPRGRGVLNKWHTDFEYIETGTGRLISEGEKIAILSIGHTGNFVQLAIAMLEPLEIKPAHYDMRFVKPLDDKLLHEVLKNFKQIICIEDGTMTGGFGTAIEEFAADNKYHVDIYKIGIPDSFVGHGEINLLYKTCGIDAENICNTIKTILHNH
jgi:1-deoxy-D-xylulose-5-phosphate synthase